MKVTQKISAFIFDMDGVIFNTEHLWKKAFELANKKFGLNLTEEYRQNCCGKNELLIRNELQGKYPQLNVAEYREYMLNYVKEAINSGDFEIKSGFNNTIDALKKNNYKIALATSSYRDRAEKLFAIKQMNPRLIFDAMIFGEDVGSKGKPDPFIFLTAAKKIQVAPEECVVIEDSINGIQAAVSGGFIPVMLIDLIPPNTFCKENSRLIVENLAEIQTLLGEL